MDEKPIAILGCGPAALMAAHACAIREKLFVIISRPIRSRIGGAQFLHRPIPGATPEMPDGHITYRLEGDPGIYQTKVYGKMDVPFVSMAAIEDGQEVPAWSLERLYSNLWEFFGPGVNDYVVDPLWLEKVKDDFSLIISSIPLRYLCWPRANHQFIQSRCRILNYAISPNLKENTVMYDGTMDRSWYRQSLIFGTGSTEYPESINPPLGPLVWANKPVWSNCDCWPDIVKIGRHGRWEKGILSHDGFYRTMEALDAM